LWGTRTGSPDLVESEVHVGFPRQDILDQSKHGVVDVATVGDAPVGELPQAIVEPAPRWWGPANRIGQGSFGHVDQQPEP